MPRVRFKTSATATTVHVHVGEQTLHPIFALCCSCVELDVHLTHAEKAVTWDDFLPITFAVTEKC